MQSYNAMNIDKINRVSGKKVNRGKIRIQIWPGAFYEVGRQLFTGDGARSEQADEEEVGGGRAAEPEMAARGGWSGSGGRRKRRRPDAASRAAAEPPEMAARCSGRPASGKRGGKRQGASGPVGVVEGPRRASRARRDSR